MLTTIWLISMAAVVCLIYFFLNLTGLYFWLVFLGYPTVCLIILKLFMTFNKTLKNDDAAPIIIEQLLMIIIGSWLLSGVLTLFLTGAHFTYVFLKSF